MTVTETATTVGRRIEWQVAEVNEIVIETPRVKSLLLRVTGWQGHLPGQHVDIRLTAEDGLSGATELFDRVATRK